MDDLLIIANYIKKRLRRTKSRIILTQKYSQAMALPSGEAFPMVRIEFTKRPFGIVLYKTYILFYVKYGHPGRGPAEHYELASPNSIEDAIKCAKKRLGMK